MLLLLGVCGCAATVGPKVAAAPREPGGHLLLVGGGDKPSAVLQRFIALAGGSDAPIVLLPLASGDSREAGAENLERFAQEGAKNVTVIHIDDRRDALREDYIEKIRQAGGVWFGGGDQSRIAERLLGTPLLEAVRAMREQGGVVGGTSAGTACQSNPMLVGEGDEHIIRAQNIVVTEGLGLFEGVLVDQHFAKRQRQNRLITAVLEHPDLVGVGIDEATAVWWKPDRTIEVLGESVVFVFDAREATITRADDRIGAVGIATAVLFPGQRYDVATRRLLDAPVAAR